MTIWVTLVVNGTLGAWVSTTVHGQSVMVRTVDSVTVYSWPLVEMVVGVGHVVVSSVTTLVVVVSPLPVVTAG